MTYIYGEVTISITLVHIRHFTVTHIQKKKKRKKNGFFLVMRTLRMYP